MKNQTSIGGKRHVVVVQNPGSPTSDGDGGSVRTWTDASPRTWHCSIEPATERDLQRVTAGTVISTASHVLKGRYHPQMTTATRLLFNARVFQVAGASNPEERSIETIVIAIEVL